MSSSDDFNYDDSDSELEFISDNESLDNFDDQAFSPCTETSTGVTPSVGSQERAVSDDSSNSGLYKVITFAQARSILDSITQRATDVVGFDIPQTLILLHTYKWDITELARCHLEDPSQLCEKLGIAGISHKTCEKSRLAVSAKSQTCPICLEKIKDPYSLQCRHAVSRDCFIQHIRINLFEGRNIFHTRCPGHFGCEVPVTRAQVADLVPLQIYQYDELVARSFLDNQPMKFRNCPHANCEYIAMRLSDAAKVPIGAINCLCGAQFCFECGLPCNHYAVPCSIAQQWLSLADKENRSSLWIYENTKNCPQCRSIIQRTEGCNHMSCFNCHYEFCWQCYRSWAEHSGNSYYKCAIIESENSNKKSYVNKLSKKRTQKLWFYMAEFDKYTAMVSNSTDEAVTNAAFNLLAWTYAFLFITAQTNAKTLLEDLAMQLIRELQEKSTASKILQRSRALNDLMTNEETKWVIDPHLKMRLDI